MKKLLFVLPCFLLLFSTQAQKTTPTQENIRGELAKGMAGFVNSVKPFYKKGVTKQQFTYYVCAPWKPSTEGSVLLAKAHDFITKGTSSETIINSYNGKEMASAIIFLKKTYDVNSKSDGAELFGGKSGINDNILARESAKEGCRWYQLWCHVQSFAQWVIDNWPTIKDIIATIAALL